MHKEFNEFYQDAYDVLRTVMLATDIHSSDAYERYAADLGLTDVVIRTNTGSLSQLYCYQHLQRRLENFYRKHVGSSTHQVPPMTVRELVMEMIRDKIGQVITGASLQACINMASCPGFEIPEGATLQVSRSVVETLLHLLNVLSADTPALDELMTDYSAATELLHQQLQQPR